MDSPGGPSGGLPGPESKNLKTDTFCRALLSGRVNPNYVLLSGRSGPLEPDVTGLVTLPKVSCILVNVSHIFVLSTAFAGTTFHLVGAFPPDSHC